MKNLSYKKRYFIFNLGVIVFVLCIMGLLWLASPYYEKNLILPSQYNQAHLAILLVFFAFILLAQRFLFTKEEIAAARPTPKEFFTFCIGLFIYYIFAMISLSYIEQQNLWDTPFHYFVQYGGLILTICILYGIQKWNRRRARKKIRND